MEENRELNTNDAIIEEATQQVDKQIEVVQKGLKGIKAKLTTKGTFRTTTIAVVGLGIAALGAAYLQQRGKTVKED